MENWTHFPPTDEDRERLDNYALFRKLMTGKHFEAYTKLAYNPHIPYITANFAGIVSKLCADLLFGEAPTFTVDNGQDALDEIINDNSLQTICHTMALSSSYRGDCVFKVRFGKFRDWDERPYPIIEAVPSQWFFPTVDANNVMGMSEAVIAWTRKIGHDLFLRREIHQPGRIINELYRMDSENHVGEQLPLNYLDEYAGLKEVEDTGYPGLLVEYVPNWRLDDCFWGISDYFDLLPLQKELNNRLTKINKILDKHSEPRLILPPGVMEYDERLQRWYVKKEDLEALEVDPEQVGDLPRYLTWDAQLTACYQEVDQLLDFLCLVTETAPASIGLTSREGGTAESGKALRFRLIRTIGKIRRKERFFDQALKNVLYAAQHLNALYGSGPAPEPVSIEWKDGLPDDPQEFAEVVNSRKAAGTISLRRALTVEGLRGEVLESELEEIANEREAQSVIPPMESYDEGGDSDGEDDEGTASTD